MRSVSSARQFRRGPRPLLVERLEDRVVLSFDAPRAFDVGSQPFAVALADLNNDGLLDLAAANRYSNNVSVLLGNGDGSFQSPRHFTAGPRPVNLAVADVNNDGQADLAVVNQGTCCQHTDTSISVLLGNGDGSFQAAQSIPAGRSLYAVAAADVDNDTRADLIVTNGTGTVSVLLGNGDGTFLDAQAFAAGSSPTSVAVADINADGRPDLAAANHVSPGGTVSVLLGNGDGSFQAARTLAAGNNSFSVAVADVNNDGLLDLAVANAGRNTWLEGSSVSVLLGNGDGSFQDARHFGAEKGPLFVAVADVNQDGLPDLAVANANDTLSVLPGNGDGSFQAAQDYAVGDYPRSLVVGDVNQDGLPDLAVANATYGVGTATVVLGTGAGAFQGTRRFAAGSAPQSVALGDVNNDGLLDLAVVNEGYSPVFNGSVSVLLGNGDGFFRNVGTLAVGRHALAVAMADMNDDGLLDLAVANYGTPGLQDTNISVLLGNGDGSFRLARTLTGVYRASHVATADVNQDGLPDLVVACDFSNDVRVFLNNGNGSFRPARAFPTGSLPNFVTVGDVNNDGLLDLVVTQDSISGGLSVLLGNGDGSFQEAQHFRTGNIPRAVTLGDFNGDGLQDLAAAITGNVYRNESSVSVLLGNGDGSFQSARHFANNTGPLSVAVADVNNDGLLDLLLASGTLRVLLGNGDGTFQVAHVSYAAGGKPNDVAVADVNGDGWLDVAIANNSSNDVSLLLNNGSWSGPGGAPGSGSCLHQGLAAVAFGLLAGEVPGSRARAGRALGAHFEVELSPPAPAVFTVRSEVPARTLPVDIKSLGGLRKSLPLPQPVGDCLSDCLAVGLLR